MINYQKKVTDLSSNLYDSSGNFYNLQNTVNAMKTKTDYITITDNDFYITIPNNKIKLECTDFYIKLVLQGLIHILQ